MQTIKILTNLVPKKMFCFLASYFCKTKQIAEEKIYPKNGGELVAKRRSPKIIFIVSALYAPSLLVMFSFCNVRSL